MLLSGAENYCFHNSHLLVQSASEVFSPRYWAFFSSSLNKFFTRRVDKTNPSFKSYHVSRPFFLLFHYFPSSSASASLWLVDGAIPAHGSSPFFAEIPIIFPGFLRGSFIFCFQRPDRAFSWGLAAPPYPWPAGGWRQTCKYHCAAMVNNLGLHSGKGPVRSKALWCLWGSIAYLASLETYFLWCREKLGGLYHIFKQFKAT